jgi:MinD superfamily P-loop ATPase
MFALINKSDINAEMTGEIERYLKENDIPVLGKWSFDTNVVESMIDRKSIVEYAPDGALSLIIRDVWRQLIGG